MPHITIEYSANVGQRTDVDALVRRVHEAVLDTGVVPLDGLRTRAREATCYLVGDGHPDNGFVAVFARLASGRPPDKRSEILQVIADTVADQLGEATDRTMISAEYIEIAPEMRVNLNFVRNRGSG